MPRNLELESSDHQNYLSSGLVESFLSGVLSGSSNHLGTCGRVLDEK